MTPSLNHPVTETEAQARARLARPGSPATQRQLEQGAAVSGVYHPPVEPWEGYAQDVLIGDAPAAGLHWEKVTLAWLVAAVLAVMIMGALMGLVW